MPDLRIVALAALFAVWWAISACNQFRSGALTFRLRQRLPFGVIPLWTFFAPNPARADARLVWREERNGIWGAWQELHFGFAPVSRRWLINPELIQNKAVTDLVSSLLRGRLQMEDRGALLSSSYVTLLNMVVAQPRQAGSSSIQFAVVRTARASQQRRVDVTFLSEVHALVGAQDNVH